VLPSLPEVAAAQPVDRESL